MYVRPKLTFVSFFYVFFSHLPLRSLDHKFGQIHTYKKHACFFSGFSCIVSISTNCLTVSSIVLTCRLKFRYHGSDGRPLQRASACVTRPVDGGVGCWAAEPVAFDLTDWSQVSWAGESLVLRQAFIMKVFSW